ncbi:MAG TPA: oligosaccharide flippase family protein [Solirubrobacteraceae bacterium]|nr:oligosaccharide flippase family protein [Solirubrobacteraceae bacterium]
MATTIRGIRLAGSGYVLTQVLNLVAYLVLVRLLTPSDYGIFAAGSLITGIGGLFAESGMLAALIKREDRLDEAASTAFYALLVSGLGLVLASLAASPLLGLAFHSRQVALVTAALSGWLFIRALTIVPDALLQRSFSFRRRVIVDPLGVVAYAAAGIPLAASGAGVWALVAAAYASIAVEAAAAWLACGFRPRRRQASVAMWRELATFSRPLVIGEVLRRVTLQVDVFVLGRFTTAATLGQYRNGQMLAAQPGGVFSQVTSYVILPAFARLAVVPGRIAAAARHAYWVAYTVIVPMSAALVPLGVPLALTLLGPTWRSAGHAIAALSGALLGNCVWSISAELMKGIGALRFQLRLQWLALVFTVLFVVPAGILWGLIGVSLAVSAATCLIVSLIMVGIARLLRLSPGQLFGGLVGPAIASLPMVGAMVLFQNAVNITAAPELRRIAMLLADVVLGAAVYCAVLAVIDRGRRELGISLLRTARRRLSRPVSARSA